jgi:hypothetical protein
MARTLLACIAALAIPAATPAAMRSRAASAGVRLCGRGSVQEYPYFDVRAHGTTCVIARHLIRRLLCTNVHGHCAALSHWHIKNDILIGHWTSPAGWHCQARIPPPVYADGRPFGSELCRRGTAWVSSKSFG